MTDSEYISHDRTRREWARRERGQRAMTNGFYFDWFLPDVMCVSSHFSALCFAFWSFDFDSIRLILFLYLYIYKSSSIRVCECDEGVKNDNLNLNFTNFLNLYLFCIIKKIAFAPFINFFYPFLINIISLCYFHFYFLIKNLSIVIQWVKNFTENAKYYWTVF